MSKLKNRKNLKDFIIKEGKRGEKKKKGKMIKHTLKYLPEA